MPSVNQYVDFINVMAYDMHGSWESGVDHHAPLYSRPWDTTTLTVDLGINYWISKGMAPSKINMGIPTYGRSWKLASSAVTPLSPATGPGSQGPLTGDDGFLAYYEICAYLKSASWQQVSSPNNTMGPYAYNLATRNWVGYDDVAMATVKANYVLAKGLGGAMVWDMSMDDFRNSCGGGVNPLMTAISTAVRASAPSVSTGASAPSTAASATTKSATAVPTTTTSTPAATPAAPPATTQSFSSLKCTFHFLRHY